MWNKYFALKIMNSQRNSVLGDAEADRQTDRQVTDT